MWVFLDSSLFWNFNLAFLNFNVLPSSGQGTSSFSLFSFRDSEMWVFVYLTLSCKSRNFHSLSFFFFFLGELPCLPSSGLILPLPRAACPWASQGRSQFTDHTPQLGDPHAYPWGFLSLSEVLAVLSTPLPSLTSLFTATTFSSFR